MLLLAYTLASAAGVNKAVLCFGTDGHIAVEIASDTGNCQTEVAYSQSLLQAHCGPCVDVDLSPGELLAARPSWGPETTAGTPPLLPLSPIPSLLPLLAYENRSVGLVQPIPALALFHSVVLLI